MARIKKGNNNACYMYTRQAEGQGNYVFSAFFVRTGGRVWSLLSTEDCRYQQGMVANLSSCGSAQQGKKETKKILSSIASVEPDIIRSWFDPSILVS